MERWKEFVGAGIFYAARELEARSCADGPVTVVGGGNGAGQAALFLASFGCEVAVAIRRPEIESGMWRYLVDRLLANPMITVRGGTQVTRLDGERVLESISMVGPAGELHDQACHGLFCFIGTEPATSWLTGVAVDEHGFIRTDVQLRSDELGGPGQHWDAHRSPSRPACPAFCRRRRTLRLNEARGRGGRRGRECGSFGAHRDRRPGMMRAGKFARSG